MHIRADMRSKRYFRSGYIVFRGILGQLRVLSRVTLLSTFSTQFSTFRVILVFPRRFSAVIHGNDRKCIKKCISVPKMSFYENNRAGNAVLSAFPGKILQKTAIKKEPPGPLVRGIPGGSCCYVVASGASLVNLILDALVGLIALDGCLREGLVIPPVHDARADGKAGGDELLELCVVDGDDGLARCAQNLVSQCQSQSCGTGDGASGDVIVVHSVVLSVENQLSWMGRACALW